jgi:hypothetical protein
MRMIKMASNLYKCSEWFDFKEKIFNLDDFCCSVCGRHNDSTVLQCHHKFYVTGRKPWEYDYEDCETLCKGCHAREHGLIPPSSEWHLVSVDDLGELAENCDLCDTEIRYKHLIIHEKFGEMTVGSDCCDNLTKESQDKLDEIKSNLSKKNVLFHQKNGSRILKNIFNINLKPSMLLYGITITTTN